jgi:hypothetical protein
MRHYVHAAFIFLCTVVQVHAIDNRDSFSFGSGVMGVRSDGFRNSKVHTHQIQPCKRAATGRSLNTERQKLAAKVQELPTRTLSQVNVAQSVAPAPAGPVCETLVDALEVESPALVSLLKQGGVRFQRATNCVNVRIMA